MDGTRRSFLKAAVTAAGAAATPGLAQAQGAARSTVTRTRRSLLTSHCESSRSNRSWSKRASSIGLPSMRSSTRWSTRWVRATEPAWWRVRGSIPPTRNVCSRTRRRRSPSWVTQRPGRAHARRREHTQGAQPGRLHTLLLLSMAGAGPAAGLVQVSALSISSGHRSARHPQRVWNASRGRRRGARVGQHRGAALYRAPRASAPAPND